MGSVVSASLFCLFVRTSTYVERFFLHCKFHINAPTPFSPVYGVRLRVEIFRTMSDGVFWKVSILNG